TRYEAGGNRVARQREDDWDDRGRLLCREDRLGPIRHNHIDLEPDELGCDLGGAFIATLRPAILDRDIPPLAPAQLTQPLHKGAGPLALCCSRARAQQPNGRLLSRLLRARRERPSSRCAAEKGDEVAPFWIKLHAIPHDERGAAPQDTELAAISQRAVSSPAPSECPEPGQGRAGQSRAAGAWPAYRASAQ